MISNNKQNLRWVLTVLCLLSGLIVLSNCGDAANSGQARPTPTPAPVAATPPPTPITLPTPTADPLALTQEELDTILATSFVPTPAPVYPPVPLTLIPVADGFARPTFLTHAGDGSGRLFVTDQEGRVHIVEDGVVQTRPFLDLSHLVITEDDYDSEQGLSSIAFHPNYGENGLFYVTYTGLEGTGVIVRYQVSSDPDVANPDSAMVLLAIEQPYENHNVNQVVFGPDSYLYIAVGDGGGDGDPEFNAQNLNSLRGKILRIDVDQGDPYEIPPDNPFVEDDQARPEIWSFGWRNPWRIAFDPVTQDMYIGNAGQYLYEGVYFEPAQAPGGLNYGWNIMEIGHCFFIVDCDPDAMGLELPIVEYHHSEGCAIIGGAIYRGAAMPALQGAYVYGDYCTGAVWALRRTEDQHWGRALLLWSQKMISSFGEDEAGELYLLDHLAGGVFRLIF
jgi:glucose/arabinose dehydrogenase